MNICANCKHMRSGHGQRLTPAWTDRTKPPPPPATISAARICATREIVPGTVDPQTGRKGGPSGVACSELNPAGKCAEFERASLWQRLSR